jgi:hypothetical protein
LHKLSFGFAVEGCKLQVAAPRTGRD